MARTDKPRLDVHQALTEQIVAAIEASSGQVTLPWHRSGRPIGRPKNIASGKPYNGINILALWVAAETAGYSSGVWGTYRQWAAKGAQVAKGAKGSLVVLYKEFEVAPDPQDADDTGKRLVTRASWVFNAAQVSGYEPEALPEVAPLDRIAAVERFVRFAGAEVRVGGDRAYYAPAADYIQMPDERLFIDTATSTRSQNWAAVELHELVHWSGAKQRLDRQFGKRFGDQTYAMEELVAEIGSAFLCADLGVAPHLRPDHAHYLAHWLAVMKSDNRAVFTAAAAASRAAVWLADRQPPFEPDAPTPTVAAPEADIQHVPIDSQGYDDTGAYWGAGPDVFIVTHSNGADSITVRAVSAEDARHKAQVGVDA